MQKTYSPWTGIWERTFLSTYKPCNKDSDAGLTGRSRKTEQNVGSGGPKWQQCPVFKAGAHRQPPVLREAPWP